jgi:hypothetical protein
VYDEHDGILTCFFFISEFMATLEQIAEGASMVHSLIGDEAPQ